ncbi:putative amino acid transporter, transmembrane domain-containing protein [Rosa chinensis]|uniref:Putative amino acid transporter, transmembrane domain-containing protein n=1 Tax=Rosa chinensis TaxID=74649 RepID=A0A2P6QGU6_ROSCH|nr:putative amino acid transporter, transmembrane domain-containing protein [Rosa chinensis]
MMTCYTSMLLKTCMDVDPSINTYLDIIERAFGNKWRIIASVFLNTELYLVALGLVIAESDNLQKLFPTFAIKLGGGAITIGCRKTFVLITACITLPTMLLTDLSILSYVSAIGVLSSLLIMGSLISVGLLGVGFHAQGGQLWNMSGLPTAVSFYIFCFAGHPVLPSIYMSMRHRHQFIKVLMISFLLTTTTCLVTAVIGYLMYGGGVKSQITLNLPTSQASAKIAIYSLLLIPITRYALMVTPVASAIEGLLPQNYQNRSLIQRVIRLVILASNTLLAFFFPYFETLMGLLGSIFVVSASFILPCACYIKLTHGFSTWSCKLVVTVAIMVFGVLAGILGTYTTIVDLVHH